MAHARGGHRSGDARVRALGRDFRVGTDHRLSGGRFSIEEILPPHDPGPWPEGFMVSREQIYDDMGRLTGGPENASGDDH